MSINNARKENREAINKGDTTSLSGGVFPVDLYREWFAEAQNAAPLLGMVRAVEMPREKMRIPKLGVGERILKDQAEGESVSEESPSSDYVELDAEKNSIYWSLTSEAVEDTVEETADVVFDQMNNQFAADAEDLGVNGDEDSATAFEAMNDGWLTIADDRGMPTYSHVDESDNAQSIDTAMFNNAVQTIDSRYRRPVNGQSPVFLVSPYQHQVYMNEIADRTTGIGDAVLGGSQLSPFGYDIVSVPTFPDDKALFTNPQNLIYGLHRDIEVSVLEESDKTHDNDLYARYAIRVRHDYELEDENAGTLITDLETPSAE